MKRIQSIPQNLRPREKLLKNGAQALSLSELVAVILTTGTKEMGVHVIGSEIEKIINTKIQKWQNSEKRKICKEELEKLKIGRHKTAQILAAQEFAIRLTSKIDMQITSPEKIFAYCHDIKSSDKEHLVCFYLNARGELLRKETVVIGSLNRASVVPSEIFSIIKEMPVSSIILAHNHPSGNLEPSVEDILFTKRIKKAADILGIALLDHVIVSINGYKRIKIS
ncbi:MAG: DNA repair protein RadC [Patescibacteria group bacterium]